MGDPARMLTRLATETLVHHAEADSDVDRFLFREAVTPRDYVTYLSRLYGVLAPLEAALVETPELDQVLDLRSRTKSALVLSDLSKLGLSASDVAALPQCRGIPTFRGPTAALGWLYVVERPMLASPVIMRHLATQLPAEMTYAASYLQCYTGHTGMMWRELGTAMDKVAQTIEVGDRIVAAAGDAFRTLQRWRTGDLTSPLRIAV